MQQHLGQKITNYQKSKKVVEIKSATFFVDKNRNIETNDWYRLANHYDYKGRIIQQFSQNHVGNIDRTDYQYRFNNEVLAMRMTHKKTGENDLIELYQYDYDHIGRKTRFKHNKGDIQQTVAGYDYDNIGRLVVKNIKPIYETGSKCTCPWYQPDSWTTGRVPTQNDNVIINTGTDITIPAGTVANAGKLTFKGGVLRNFGKLNLGDFGSKLPANAPSAADPTLVGVLQTIDYKYHIRGLRGINLDGNNMPVLANGDLFSFKLGYEEGTSGYFDGNIASQTWLSAVDNLSRSYTYTYDGANRIKTGTFTGGKPSENYSLENLNYDANGNITSLWRKGMTQTNTFDYVDKLGYTYATNSNKLTSISDAITGNLNTGDFRDGNTSGNDYTYWADGSLKSDLNKGISQIDYNYLKLHKRITFSDGRVVNFQYDASGKKLKEIASNGDMTDYVGNKIYKNNALYQIAHDEGRIINSNYEYNINDHLGNLRLSFKDSSGIAKITQAQDYEPFGLENWTSKYVNSSKISNFKFNGIEKQKETNMYLAAFRGLDSQIGRWTQIDPKPNESMSLYSAMNNNPVRYFDPLGDTVFVNKFGYILRNDQKDNFVFMQSEKGQLTKLGELGKKINISTVYKNLLKLNIAIAKATGSIFAFQENVRTGGVWDLKNAKNSIYGIGNDGKTQFTFGKQSLESQDIGNHHFGAVAKGFGFGETFTLKQAGEYQMRSGTSRPEWQKSRIIGTGYGFTIDKGSEPPYGDDPRDQNWIKEGFKYYDEHKNEKNEK
jgi:RHS repeat-associated protein